MSQDKYKIDKRLFSDRIVYGILLKNTNYVVGHIVKNNHGLIKFISNTEGITIEKMKDMLQIMESLK